VRKARTNAIGQYDVDYMCQIGPDPLILGSMRVWTTSSRNRQEQDPAVFRGKLGGVLSQERVRRVKTFKVHLN
jgi:hypothetical protein